MDRRQVLATYDDGYARTYDDRFILPKHYRRKNEFELKVIADLLGEGARWLDVACGTGYFLARFPGVARAGLDLSPAMLTLARQANPDALFFREGDFTEAEPEWEGEWDLVTCMWYSYGLVESLAAVERLIANLGAWVSDRGSCFVPLCDPENLGRGIRVPYRHRNAGFPPGELLITSVTWTWIEDSGERHHDLVAPTVEHMVAMFERRFDHVELVEYPKFKWWGRRNRRGLVAKAPKRVR